MTKLMKTCLGCMKFNNGQTYRPIPYGSQLTATKTGVLVSLDFLHVGNSHPDYHGLTQILVIKDNFSRIVQLSATQSCNAKEAASALMNWFSRFGICEFLISDNAQCFKSELLALMSKTLGYTRHFTMPRVHISNGSVERANREVNKLLKHLTHEYKIDIAHWPSLLPSIEYSMNTHPREVLDNLTPIEVLTGRKPPHAMDDLNIGDVNVLITPLNTVQNDKKLSSRCRKFREALEGLHKRVERRI